jgi:hypothetical protein
MLDVYIFKEGNTCAISMCVSVVMNGQAILILLASLALILE